MGVGLLIFSVVSIFPEMINEFAKFGVTARACSNGLLKINALNPRDFTHDNYRRIDDKTFGGGSGMVMKIEPLELALAEVKVEQNAQGVEKPLVIYLSPQGKRVDQQLINQLAGQAGIILICGRYEGVDERFIERNVDLELSIGDFVVSGGEVPAMLVIEAVARQLPGVLNSVESVTQDSFMNARLDYPHYTHPVNYHGDMVPEVLLSGNHAQIKKWRLQQSLWRTYTRRPDLLQTRTLTKEESRLLDEMIQANDSADKF